MKNGGKKPGCFAFTGKALVHILCCLIGFYIVTGIMSMASKHINYQKKAEISLNEIVEKGENLPIGSYVELDARLVLGPYASYTETQTFTISGEDSGATATTSVKYYYYVFLEDGRIMTLATTNEQEIIALDRITAWVADSDDLTEGETLTVRGRLSEMEDDELRTYYEKYLYLMGVERNSPQMCYVVLDTTAGREGAYIAVVVCVVGVVILYALNKKVRKRRAKKEKEMAEFAQAWEEIDGIVKKDERDTLE